MTYPGLQSRLISFSRPTIFIHGNLGCNLWWQPLLTEMAEPMRSTGYFWEWRGCGSAKHLLNTSELTWNGLTEDLSNFLHTQDLPVNIVAHSTGAGIALRAALAMPHKILKIALVSPIPLKPMNISNETKQVFAKMPNNRDLLQKVLLGTMHKHYLTPAFTQSLVDSAFSVHPKVWLGVLELLEHNNLYNHTANVRTPTLIMHGAHDQVIPIENSLNYNLPNVQVLKMEGIGHCYNLESPLEFYKNLVNFFE